MNYRILIWTVIFLFLFSPCFSITYNYSTKPSGPFSYDFPDKFCYMDYTEKGIVPSLYSNYGDNDIDCCKSEYLGEYAGLGGERNCCGDDCINFEMTFNWDDSSYNKRKLISVKYLRYNSFISIDPKTYDTTGLVASYHFSSNAFDSSGNGYNAQYVHEAQYSAGYREKGEGLKFDGIDDYASLPGSSCNFNTYDSFTISFWVKSGDGNANQDAILEKWTSAGGPYSFVFRYYMGDVVEFARYDGTHNPAVISVTKINDGRWHHVVGVVDSYSRIMYLYIDGKLDAFAKDTTTGTTVNSANLYLASRGGSMLYFNGTIDEIRIYNRALSHDEILELYHERYGRLDYVDIKFYLKGLDGKYKETEFYYENDKSFLVKVANVLFGGGGFLSSLRKNAKIRMYYDSLYASNSINTNIPSSVKYNVDRNPILTYGSEEKAKTCKLSSDPVCTTKTIYIGKDITLAEQSGTDLLDYQVKLVIDTYSLISSGKMNSDCSGIKFVTSSGENIPYYIESGCNTHTTIIWIKVPKIPASGTETIRMYYGKDLRYTSSASQPKDIFELYDDFNGPLGNQWYAHNAARLYGSSLVKINKHGFIESKKLFNPPLIFETRLKTFTSFQFGFGDFPNSPNQRATAYWENSLFYLADGRGYPTGIHLDFSRGRYGTLKFTWLNLKKKYETLTYGSKTISRMSSSVATSPLRAGFDAYLGDDAVYVDWVRIRKYASPEPAIANEKEISIDITSCDLGSEAWYDFSGLICCDGALFADEDSSQCACETAGGTWVGDTSNPEYACCDKGLIDGSLDFWKNNMGLCSSGEWYPGAECINVENCNQLYCPGHPNCCYGDNKKTYDCVNGKCVLISDECSTECAECCTNSDCQEEKDTANFRWKAPYCFLSANGNKCAGWENVACWSDDDCSSFGSLESYPDAGITSKGGCFEVYHYDTKTVDKVCKVKEGSPYKCLETHSTCSREVVDDSCGECDKSFVCWFCADWNALCNCKPTYKTEYYSCDYEYQLCHNWAYAYDRNSVLRYTSHSNNWQSGHRDRSPDYNLLSWSSLP